MADIPETHATLNSTKGFLNFNLADNTKDDRLKDVVAKGSAWLVLQLGFDPTPTAQTQLVASQYAAGLWEQANAQDKTKETQNMIEAKTNLEELRRLLSVRTFPSTKYADEIDPVDV